MLKYTRCRVLLPERILKENQLEQKFLLMVKDYLTRYKNYKLIKVEGPFAICDREDEVVERRKKRNGKI